MHVRRMEEKPDKLHEEPEPISSPYVKKTGKLTKKEIREQASKNKSILGWARRDDDIIPLGGVGTRDEPEEVRQARTTGGIIHLQTSQEVKDGPEDWKSGKEDGIG